MYVIELTTWYPETPDVEYKEILPNSEFELIENTVKFLNNNIDYILNEYPVIGINITIMNNI